MSKIQPKSVRLINVTVLYVLMVLRWSHDLECLRSSSQTTQLKHNRSNDPLSIAATYLTNLSQIYNVKDHILLVTSQWPKRKFLCPLFEARTARTSETMMMTRGGFHNSTFHCFHPVWFTFTTGSIYSVQIKMKSSSTNFGTIKGEIQREKPPTSREFDV